MSGRHGSWWSAGHEGVHEEKSERHGCGCTDMACSKEAVSEI